MFVSTNSGRFTGEKLFTKLSKMSGNNYIIEGGAEGKKRLEVIASILNGHTKQLLEGIATLDGKHFLDVGCGGGSVSLMVAQLAGANGNVTGIDFDNEIIKLAEKDATDKGINNISFRAMNVYDIDYAPTFDMAYARFLLTHLTQPSLVIEKMIASLQTGGTIVIEDIDFSGHYCFPPSAAFNTYVDCFTKAAHNNNQDANIGLQLYEMLKGCNLHHVQFDVIQPVYNTGDGKWMAYFTFDKIKESILKQGLLIKDEFETILQQLKTFTEDENTIISLPRIFRVWGRKG